MISLIPPARECPGVCRYTRHLLSVMCIFFVIAAAGCGRSSSRSASATRAPVAQPASHPVSLKLPASVNSLGMQFVQLPAGEFEMGSPDSDDLSNPDEKPVHLERIAHPFWLGVHEVTIGQFRKFVDATGYQTAAEKSGEGGFAYDPRIQRLEPDRQSSWRLTGFPQDDSHPVVNVNWNDVQAFCTWLNGEEKATYRLPTEAEWEYACRAGSTTRWSYGSQQECLVGMANICDTSLQQAYPFAKWSMEWNDGYAFTAPVGSFPANSYDLFDMQGNVFEWCADAWKGTDYADQPVPDPSTPDISDMRIVRGGSYLSLIMFTRSADRVALKAVQRNAITGFRVVKDLIVDTIPAGKKIHE
jgi:sulfatase modifying factor 1